MRLNNLNLNQLVVLDALLTEQSVKKAADKVFLTPAATSCSLAKLREFFEDELLTQVGKTMFLTHKAKCLQQPVRDALLQIQAIINIDPSFDPKTSSCKIVIEASDYIFNILVSGFLKKITAQAPNFKFDLRLLGTQSLEDLNAGEIDLLIAPEFYMAEQHPKSFLFEDSWSCVVWEGHELADKKLSIDQYAQLGHIVTEWGAGRIMSSDESSAVKQGIERNRVITIPNYMMIKDLLNETNRIATVQSMLAKKLCSNAPLKIVECPMNIAPLKEFVQCNRYKMQDPAVSWFKEELIKFAKTI